MSRTFHIRFGDNIATGFVIDVDDRQYFVTAKHVLADAAEEFVLSIFHDGDWRDVTARLVGHCEGEIDITVASLPILLAHSEFVLKPCMAGVSIGHDAYFLGYPYGFLGIMSSLTNDYPIPFVKRAIVSSMQMSPNGPCVFFLDGHNNPGFSGGPVVVKIPGSNDFKVVAVISSYRFTNENTYHAGKQLEITYKSNTGIIISYGIRHAVDIANANPIGFEIT